jgi:hypothetical protein
VRGGHVRQRLEIAATRNLTEIAPTLHLVDRTCLAFFCRLASQELQKARVMRAKMANSVGKGKKDGTPLSRDGRRL